MNRRSWLVQPRRNDITFTIQFRLFVQQYHRRSCYNNKIDLKKNNVLKNKSDIGFVVFTRSTIDRRTKTAAPRRDATKHRTTFICEFLLSFPPKFVYCYRQFFFVYLPSTTLTRLFPRRRSLLASSTNKNPYIYRCHGDARHCRTFIRYGRPSSLPTR